MKSIKTETQYQLSVAQLHVANTKKYHTGMVTQLDYLVGNVDIFCLKQLSHWMSYSHGSTKPEQLDI
jgi:hypothetical protein